MPRNAEDFPSHRSWPPRSTIRLKIVSAAQWISAAQGSSIISRAASSLPRSREHAVAVAGSSTWYRVAPRAGWRMTKRKRPAWSARAEAMVCHRPRRSR